MEAFVAGVNIVFMRDTGRGEQRCFPVYAAGISAISSPCRDGQKLPPAAPLPADAPVAPAPPPDGATLLLKATQ